MRDRERALVAAIRAGAAFEGLGLAEVGDDALEVPSLASERRPVVKVLLASAYVGHRVDRARAAQHSASRHVVPLPAPGRVRLRREAPVEAGIAVGAELAPPRHQHLQSPVRATRLQHQHPALPVFRQARRHHAARGAGTYHHVVELHRWSRLGGGGVEALHCAPRRQTESRGGASSFRPTVECVAGQRYRRRRDAP